MTEKRFHIGTMGWSYDFWIGNFYPPDTSPHDFLFEYSKNFSTVEIDSTFYRIPHERTVKKWRDHTPPDFLFSVKFPKKITHEKMLRASKDDLDFFIRNISFFGNKLGPMLLQFPYSFKIKEFDVLKDFLSILPKSHKYVVEVQHKSWLEERFYAMLKGNNIALASTVTPWMSELNQVTADFIYLRWKGNRKQIKGTTGKIERERRTEILEWAEKIKDLLNDSLEIFGYFSKYYSGHSPTDVKLLISNLSNTS